MKTLHDHQSAVELDAERARVANAMDSARAELDALATRMP